eukprot:1556246-Ditylum_brightwellii.AAC.1
MFDYFKAVRWPIQVDPRDHSNRKETGICFQNKLPGFIPQINTDHTKKMIADSFHATIEMKDDNIYPLLQINN